jgi:hypothetical protein
VLGLPTRLTDDRPSNAYFFLRRRLGDSTFLTNTLPAAR